MAGGFLSRAAASNLEHLLDHRFRNRTMLLAMPVIHLLFIPLNLMLGWVSDRLGIETAVLFLTFLPGATAVLTLRLLLRKEESLRQPA